MQTLNLKLIQYLNLFEKETKVRTKHCFFYNNYIVFAVPSLLVSKAIGSDGKNVKKLAGIMRRKIKIVALPENIEKAEKFISEIVSPIEFKNLEVTQEELIISASRQSKASLIGRNKVRLEELKKVVEEFFGKRLRIV